MLLELLWKGGTARGRGPIGMGLIGVLGTFSRTCCAQRERVASVVRPATSLLPHAPHLAAVYLLQSGQYLGPGLHAGQSLGGSAPPPLPEQLRVSKQLVP